jgi:hypothetical protein
MSDPSTPSSLDGERLIVGLTGGGGADGGRLVWIRLRTADGEDRDFAVAATHVPILIDAIEILAGEAARLRRINSLEPFQAPILPFVSEYWRARVRKNGDLELRIEGAQDRKLVVQVPSAGVKSLLLTLTRALAR